MSAAVGAAYGQKYKKKTAHVAKPLVFSTFAPMKTICIALGSVSLALGIVGIFLPLVPTTPFLLLAAALYFRGSPHLYTWLMNHPRLGPYIRRFREDKALPLRVKIVSITLMWITIVHCTFFLVSLWWIKVALWVVSAIATAYILSFKTLR